MQVLGLAPYLPPHRPNAPARWWRAEAVWKGDRLMVERLREGEDPGAVKSPCGLVAPTSLPREFLAHLRIEGPREAVLRALDRFTRDRLHHEARAFAARRPRGERYPRRHPAESLSALDRRRLALFHAALPVLRACPEIVEVDAAARLRALDLPATDLGGDRPEAVRKRAAILDALREGVLGFGLEVSERDLAVASRPALDAVLAAGVAAS